MKSNPRSEGIGASIWRTFSQSRLPSWIDGLLVVTWAFGWNYVVGHFGVFAFDQSQLFDSGWRIKVGQVPYKDFLMAFGPLASVLQAGFFELCGVTWTAMVISAAVINASAALSMMQTVRLVFGDGSRWPALVTGVLVGTSFQATYGTIMFEQCAFLFLFFGIRLLAKSQPSFRARLLVCLASGMCGGIAFFGKQNAGVLTIIALAVLVVLTGTLTLEGCIRDLLAYLSGVAVVLGTFATWLFACSDPHLFWRHAVEVPAVARSGVLSAFGNLFPPLLLSRIPGTTPWCTAFALAVASCAFWQMRHQAGARNSFHTQVSFRILIALATGIPLLQSLFQVSTLNGTQNVVFFSAVTLFSGFGLLKRLTDSPSLRAFAWFFPAAALCLFVEMAHNSWARRIHDVFPMRTTIGRRLTAPPFVHVRWVEPTIVRGTVMNPGDIEAILAYLSKRQEAFLLLGDSSFLYGMTGRVPPTPILYFQTDHCYTSSDFSKLDTWMLADAKRSDVHLVVRERNSFCFDFPFTATQRWIDENFQSQISFGNYEVFERRR
jgi:hypothetical protein